MEYVKIKSEQNKESFLKDLENWKKDLKRINKILRSVSPVRNPKSIYPSEKLNPQDIDKIKKEYSEGLSKFKEAHSIVNKFRNNFETWVYKKLLVKKYDPEHTESYYERRVREDAWSAILSVDTYKLFPETYNYDLDKHIYAPEHIKKKEQDASINRHNKAFKIAFESIKEFLDQNIIDESSNSYEQEQVQVGPVNVVITPYGRKEFYDKYVKIFFSNLKSAISKIKKAGLERVLKGLNITIKFISEGDAAGKYTFPDIDIFLSSIGGYEESVVIHEIGHRFYHDLLSKKAQSFWDNGIYNPMATIEEKDVEKFVNLFIANDIEKFRELKHTQRKKYLMPLIKKSNLSQIEKSKFLEIASRLTVFDVDESVDSFKDKLAKRVSGTKVHLEFISEYARKNSDEAFSESFAKYLGYGSGKLGEYTLDLFKRTIKLGDTNFKGNTMKYVNIKSNDKEINIPDINIENKGDLIRATNRILDYLYRNRNNNINSLSVDVLNKITDLIFNDIDLKRVENIINQKPGFTADYNKNEERLYIKTPEKL